MSSRNWAVTGSDVPELQHFDQLIQTFMQERSIPNASAAISYQGRLVLARAYTWSDDASEAAIQPDARFRIASISKPITAVAIMRLVQEGKLSLDDKVDQLIALVPADGQQADPRQADITVRHLLQHLGGWDRDVSFDAMFMDQPISEAFGLELPISIDDVIRFMSGQKLDHDPGTKYAYSNYGYCLLGRIIEKLSGLSYDDYVKQILLEPLGMQDTLLGKTLLEGRQAKEVAYFSDEEVPSVFDSSRPTVNFAYGGFNIENMDAHGGWISSAIDLVRFADSLDLAQEGPILSHETIREMLAEPVIGKNEQGVYYGCGWRVLLENGGYTIGHRGSLPGTLTHLTKRANGVTWSVLFNQRNDPSGLPYDKFEDLMFAASDATESWPEHDLSK
jgi:CubicO group peptidase (beta-lactamase class C family)